MDTIQRGEPMNDLISRPGAEMLKERMIVSNESLFRMEATDKQDFTKYLEERLQEQLGKRIADIMQTGDYVFSKFKVMTYGETEGDPNGFHCHNTVYQAESFYRPFTFCENCQLFIREEANGGICPRMNEIVHITDGCTFGIDMRGEE